MMRLLPLLTMDLRKMVVFTSDYAHSRRSSAMNAFSTQIQLEKNVWRRRSSIFFPDMYCCTKKCTERNLCVEKKGKVKNKIR